jgi:hypothetical protein
MAGAALAAFRSVIAQATFASDVDANGPLILLRAQASRSAAV